MVQCVTAMKMAGGQHVLQCRIVLAWAGDPQIKLRYDRRWAGRDGVDCPPLRTVIGWWRQCRFDLGIVKPEGRQRLTRLTATDAIQTADLVSGHVLVVFF